MACDNPEGVPIACGSGLWAAVVPKGHLLIAFAQGANSSVVFLLDLPVRDCLVFQVMLEAELSAV